MVRSITLKPAITINNQQSIATINLLVMPVLSNKIVELIVYVVVECQLAHNNNIIMGVPSYN